jgi:hypothetical protein
MMGAMLLAGIVQDSVPEDSLRFPIRVDWSVIPILFTALVYAIQRIRRPRRYAFVLAGALVCALGGVLRADIELSQRALDAFRGVILGAIVTGLLMNIDDDTSALLEGGAQPWRELFVAILLVTFGSMPSSIYGGVFLAWPTILLGLVLLVRCLRYDAPLVVPHKDAGALARVFLALLFVLLGLGFLVVCPMISFGMQRQR